MVIFNTKAPVISVMLAQDTFLLDFVHSNKIKKYIYIYIYTLCNAPDELCVLVVFGGKLHPQEFDVPQVVELCLVLLLPGQPQACLAQDRCQCPSTAQLIPYKFPTNYPLIPY